MIIAAIYLSVGICLAGVYYFTLNRSIKKSDEGTTSAEEDGFLDNTSQTAVQLPGGVLNILISTVLFWPLALILLVVNKFSHKEV